MFDQSANQGRTGTFAMLVHRARQRLQPAPLETGTSANDSAPGVRGPQVAAQARGTRWGVRLLAVVTATALEALVLAGGPDAKAKPRKGMELPPELQAGATEAKVTYRKLFIWPEKPVAEMLRFEPYRVVDFRRGWSKNPSRSLLVFVDGWTFHWTADKNTYDYSFDVIGPEDRRWSCSCAAASSSRGMFVGGEHMGIGMPGHGQARLACVLQAPDDPTEWRFELGVDLKPGLLPTKTALGWARHGGDEIALTGTERMAKWGRSPGRLFGLVLKMNDRPVAAVDLISKPAVIFGAELPVQFHDAVAVVGAAALLFPDELEPFAPRGM